MHLALVTEHVRKDSFEGFYIKLKLGQEAERAHVERNDRRTMEAVELLRCPEDGTVAAHCDDVADCFPRILISVNEYLWGKFGAAE